MTNTRSIYPPLVPGWADLLAQKGALPPHTDGPGIPPWGSLHQDIGHEPPRRSNLVLWAVLIGLTLGVLFATGVLLRQHHVFPFAQDSGVAACEAMASGAAPTGEKDAKTWSKADYEAAREVFADSRYPAIRDNGVDLIDVVWQMRGLDDNDMGVLIFVNSLVKAYAGLSGGCAEAGYTLPAFGQS